MIKEVPHNFKVKRIIAPASKSYAQRAILAASLSAGESIIRNVGTSDDVQNILQIAIQLGASITASGDDVTIKGLTRAPNRTLDCGESGLGIRLTTSISSTFGGDFTIKGKGSLTFRPMREFESFLPQLGVNFTSNKGLVPLEISGKLTGGKAHVDGQMSSQFLSGLLMALPRAINDSELRVKDLRSKPYVDMTIDLLSAFGIEVNHENYEVFHLPGNQNYQSTEYEVEGDWSGAAFWVVHGAINGPINILGLNQNSLQADRAILKALDLAKVDYSWNHSILTVEKSKIQPFEFDATHCPDLFPILVVLAAAAKGTSYIHGVNRLRYKESKRGEVLQKEFKTLDLPIQILDNTMAINGSGKLASGMISSNNDHRIAMAAAISSNLTEGMISIKHAEAVNKSYPEFWDEINN